MFQTNMLLIHEPSTLMWGFKLQVWINKKQVVTMMLIIFSYMFVLFFYYDCYYRSYYSNIVLLWLFVFPLGVSISTVSFVCTYSAYFPCVLLVCWILISSLLNFVFSTFLKSTRFVPYIKPCPAVKSTFGSTTCA